MKIFIGCAAALMIGSSALGSVVTIDFSTDDDGVTPLLNGQVVASPGFFGTYFNLSSLGSRQLGPVIFDSNPAGPNAGGPDPDLLVGLGNILMMQDDSRPAMTVPGFFDTPDDAALGGVLVFDFTSPVALQSVDLVDINGNGPVVLTLTDGGGLTRTYSVPRHWTFDRTVSPNGYDTLDLTSLLPQTGEGGQTATAAEQFGFDASGVVRLEVDFDGSGGLDNLVIVPAPGAAFLLAAAGGLLLRRRR